MHKDEVPNAYFNGWNLAPENQVGRDPQENAEFTHGRDASRRKLAELGIIKHFNHQNVLCYTATGMPIEDVSPVAAMPFVKDEKEVERTDGGVAEPTCGEEELAA